MGTTLLIIVAVAVAITLWLIVGSMRHGATFREVLPTAALLGFGIALAAGLQVLEGELFPFIKYESAGTTYYLSLGIPSVVAIAVCVGIARVWEKVFPPKPEKIGPG